MFKFSKITSRFVMLGVLSTCLVFALLTNPIKIAATTGPCDWFPYCVDVCKNGQVCKLVYVEELGWFDLDDCRPPDDSHQCPVE